MDIKELKNKLIEKWYYWRAKRGMLHRYRSDKEVSEILEKWISKAIMIDKQKQRRDELLQMRGRVAESKKFIEFIDKLK